ncbi:hypothetical protein OII43_07085 [Achromobacter ruhlandii]|nr:hypothetical protein [Achromobacter ruhlandii]MCV6795810.1 hypothetical protein [Achromobacter ruhlandii]MCV6807782.1 hypothetical protein [Achromobacter ruhlandii]
MGATLLSEIPFAMIEPHEAQAKRNHGQSLNRLADRGGLAVPEALDILEGRPWASSKNCLNNERYLVHLVREWRAAQRDKELRQLDACTCPSGDGSLRHPCAAHPAKASGNGGQEWSDS